MGGLISTTEIECKKKYGWIRDKLDPRDHYHNFDNIEYPEKVDIRNPNKEIKIYDQGVLGSCTANAIAYAYQYDEIEQEEKCIFTPSRLFIYYNERAMEGTVDLDAGAQIRDGIKSINKDGVCLEVDWPYNISKFTIKPYDKCYVEGKKYHSVKYKRLNINLKDMKACLNLKLPFVFGFVVYESFENIGKDGIMKMPQKDKYGNITETMLGGHAVVAVGYNDNMETDEEKGYFIIRNSWGKNWGSELAPGHFYMPYKFIINSNYCSDFWTIQKITNPK